MSSSGSCGIISRKGKVGRGLLPSAARAGQGSRTAELLGFRELPLPQHRSRGTQSRCFASLSSGSRASLGRVQAELNKLGKAKRS